MTARDVQVWQLWTLGEVVKPNGLQTGPFGSQLKASEYTDEGIPVVMPSDLINYRISTDKIARIPKVRTDELSRHKLEAGDIIFGRRGDIGRCGLVGELEVGWICGTGCLRARLDNTKVLPEFIIQHLDLPDSVAWLQTNAVGQTMLNLNTTILSALPLHIPPLEEQRKIAAILGTWDRAIGLVEALIAALQARKRGLMQMMIPNEKNLPNGWKSGRLRDFIVQYRDYINKVESKPYPRISVKWWAKGAVVAGYDYGDDVKMKRHQLAKAGQIIVSEIWAKHGSIGIIPQDGDGALITSHFYLFDLLESAEMYKTYIHELVNANYFMIQADRTSQGSTGYASIRANDFLDFKLPIPPKGTEIKIGNILSMCNRLVKYYEEYTTHLQQQKKGLMQQLLTGQVRVKVD